MFTTLTLTNFRSFDHIQIKLSKRNGAPKGFVMIFGENGAGKSNLVHAFQMFIDLLGTMDVRDAYEEFLAQKSIFNDERMEQQYKQQYISQLRDLKAIISDCKMIGCDEPIRVEFGFQIDQANGTYIVELGSSEVVYESMEFLLNKRRGTYFECRPGHIMINPAVILSKGFLSDLRSSCKRFWGKHTFLSILLHELRDKSKTYGWDSLSKNFQSIIYTFSNLSYHSHLSADYVENSNSDLMFYPLRNAVEGYVPAEREKMLDQMANIVSQFFHAINSHIHHAYYDKETIGQLIKYQLYFEKNIAGKNRSIPFKRESTGNLQLLKVLCATLAASLGDTVIIDEADAGIHDVLFQKLIEELAPVIQGQLIITSHNTMLLETSCARDAVYIITEDEDSTKIKCISDFENRTFINNNIRNKYLNNDYKGIPTVMPIDFDALKYATMLLRVPNRQ